MAGERVTRVNVGIQQKRSNHEVGPWSTCSKVGKRILITGSTLRASVMRQVPMSKLVRWHECPRNSPSQPEFTAVSGSMLIPKYRNVAGE